MFSKIVLAFAVLICVQWCDAGFGGKCKPTEAQIAVISGCYKKVTGADFGPDAMEKMQADKEAAKKVGHCTLIEHKIIDEGNTKFDEALAIQMAKESTDDEAVKTAVEAGIKGCMSGADNEAKLTCMHGKIKEACGA